MSNFIAPTRYPDEAGEIQPATWLDDYFGPHEYGVRFPNGKVFHEKEIRHMITAKRPNSKSLYITSQFLMRS